jgi:hypothetical protein
MIQIPIAAIASQSLSINLAGNLYDLRIHACKDASAPGTEVMAVDLAINNVVVVTGMRALSDFPIIPARYLENGNFIISTQGDDYPDWRQFGITQSLVFASQDELNALRVPS